MELDNNHIYTKDGKEYKSVSKYIEELSTPFPKDFIAEKCAKKDGVEKQDILDKWQMNADISTGLGTAIHAGIEYWIKYGEIHKNPIIKNIVEKFAQQNNREELRSELVIYDEDRMLAGTIDIIKKVEGGYKLLDIKTNTEISEDSKGYFKAPYNKVKENTLNKYRIQLSLYAEMMEKLGHTIKAIELWHWNGEEFIIKELKKCTTNI